ncbi:hypothetical protein [Wolbachia endosymbiont of Mansonella perstans]|uniref:hypothetical protein n=1 Tax=Wolbachia endosymbiont of Mansonella perstans TaxID=229526 RepID=UPI001CE072F5|nr:hypothetical protein [Wolbachia endosymbiont of Mansonella perstans]MCA4774054.1 hypothetical protein [Wolbachia endosymbiont of Mansonella perstans]
MERAINSLIAGELFNLPLGFGITIEKFDQDLSKNFLNNMTEDFQVAPFPR